MSRKIAEKAGKQDECDSARLHTDVLENAYSSCSEKNRDLPRNNQQSQSSEIKFKKCPNCDTLKELILFSKRTNPKYYHSWCKMCESKSGSERQNAQYRNSSAVRKQRNTCSSLCNKKRYKEDPSYREYERKRHREADRKRRKEDPLFRFKGNIRSIVRKAFKIKNLKKAIKTEKVLGIDLETFFTYFNKLAIDKYGTPYDSETMDIEHRVPQYTANTEEEVINVNHYTNLQPMLKSEHIEKTKQDAHNRAKLKRHVEG
jgi:hypothetical protein